ncbi:hypothetical protein PIB30_074983 [Stylosanthes scabra]|uniref:Uncharacterized protein n=1 Tax=Stylosanthes scabra TaxID=79078 RepID=A0ABU6XPT2_9FABA|nr:hypothetical protein [Stylosanthes scabra]
MSSKERELGAGSVSANKYSWVAEAVRSISPMFVDVQAVRRLGDPSLWVRSGKNVAVEFLPCLSSEKVCHEGQKAEWFFMYACVLSEVGVRFPFTKFEAAELCPISVGIYSIFRNIDGVSARRAITGVVLLSVSSQRDFKGFYVKVTSPKDAFPFFLDENLSEKFPLYWNKSLVQCLDAVELSEGDAVISEFLFENLKGGKFLTTSELLMWESNKCMVIKYLETKVPDCSTAGLKSFFKQRAEREVSTSLVVKTE